MKLYLLFALFFFTTILNAQNLITGKIKDVYNNDMSFASVYLTEVNDTNKVVKASITDFYGNYSLNEIKNSVYRIAVSSIGYEYIYSKIELKGKDTIINFTLKSKIIGLSTVNIVANNITKTANKTTYNITKSDIDLSTTAMNLLQKIPNIKVDEVNKKITTLTNGNVKILINGINATEQDLLSLQPEQVVNIEYYDLPPVRFSDSDISSVANVITKKGIEGYEVSADFQNALFTGFGNDLFSIKYNKKNSQIKLLYNFGYRKYSSMYIAEDFLYNINNIQYNIIKTSEKSKMGYTQNDISLNFNRNKENNYIININIMPNFYNGYYDINQKAIIKENELIDSSHFLTTNKYDQFNPVLDLYLSKKFVKKQELAINIVSSMFFANYKDEKTENYFSPDTSIFNATLIDGKKKSIISEVTYSKQYEKINISSGFKYSFLSSININKKNSINNTTNSEINDYLGYGELSGKIKKLTYSLSLGICINSFSDKNNNYTFKTFRPIIRINYPLNNYSNIKVVYSLKPHTPDLSELNNDQYYLEKKYYFTGNSELKPYNCNNSNIEYSFYKQIIKLSTQISYKYSKNTILPQYILKDYIIIQQENNQLWEKEYGLSAFATLNPLKSNNLNFIIGGKLYNTENKIENLNSNSIIGNMWAAFISYKYHNWSFRCAYQSKMKHLVGENIQFDPDYSFASIQYMKKNIAISLGSLFLFQKSYNKTSSTISKALIQKNSRTDIYDNGNMLFINFTYNFSSGKKHMEKEQLINNKDNDSGIIQPKP